MRAASAGKTRIAPEAIQRNESGLSKGPSCTQSRIARTGSRPAISILCFLHRLDYNVSDRRLASGMRQPIQDVTRRLGSRYYPCLREANFSASVVLKEGIQGYDLVGTNCGVLIPRYNLSGANDYGSRTCSDSFLRSAPACRVVYPTSELHLLLDTEKTIYIQSPNGVMLEFVFDTQPPSPLIRDLGYAISLSRSMISTRHMKS